MEPDFSCSFPNSISHGDQLITMAEFADIIATLTTIMNALMAKLAMLTTQMDSNANNNNINSNNINNNSSRGNSSFSSRSRLSLLPLISIENLERKQLTSPRMYQTPVKGGYDEDMKEHGIDIN